MEIFNKKNKISGPNWRELLKLWSELREANFVKSKFFFFLFSSHAIVSSLSFYSVFSKISNFEAFRGFGEDKEKRNSRYANMERENER